MLISRITVNVVVSRLSMVLWCGQFWVERRRFPTFVLEELRFNN